MTTISRTESLVDKTREARANAEALLAGLLEAKSASEQRLAEIRRPDPLKQVTGRSSLDNAIDATRRMIETLDRNLAEVQRAKARTNGFVFVPEVVLGRQPVG